MWCYVYMDGWMETFQKARVLPANVGVSCKKSFESDLELLLTSISLDAAQVGLGHGTGWEAVVGPLPLWGRGSERVELWTGRGMSHFLSWWFRTKAGTLSDLWLSWCHLLNWLVAFPKACCILLPCEGSSTTRKLCFCPWWACSPQRQQETGRERERDRDASTLGQCRIIWTC